MDVAWNLYRFDYARYVQIRPLLRTAVEAPAFAAVSDCPETDAIVEALIDGEVVPTEARQAFVISLCCVGDALPCPRSFPLILKQIRRDIRSEAGAEMLTDAIAGGRNLDTWLRPSAKFAGFLTPDETSTVWGLYKLAELRVRAPYERSRGRTRRGGLINNAASFVRRLFDLGLGADEVYRLLGELLEDAVYHSQGVAVVAV